MRAVRFLVVGILIVLLFGCSNPGLKIHTSEGANPWTNLRFCNKQEDFQFAIVSDLWGSYRHGVFEAAVAKLNLLMPEFVMSIGDMIEGDTADLLEIDQQWDEFDGYLKKLKMSFFYTAGNHDISNDVMTAKWHERLGRTYYHFSYHNVLFLVLNTEDPPATNISDAQIEYFRDVLEDNPSVRWTLVFMHKPLWRREEQQNWGRFESMLADREYTVFAGHNHKYSKTVRNGRNYYVLAATGGGKAEDLVEKCRFDHIVWVTMTDEGPVLANLMLDGIFDDQPCLE